MIDFKRILIPVDFSVESREAARIALELARRFDGALEFLHVIHSGYVDIGMGHIIQDPEVERERLREIAEKRLAEFRESLDTHGVRTTSAVRAGRPSTEILAYVDEAAPDLVVMGTHGRTGVKRFIMGSEAELVLRSCRLPVLVVHAGSDD